MRRIALVLFALGAVGALAQTPATTTISDTYYAGKFSVTVQPAKPFITADGVELQPFYRVSATSETGQFSIALPPNTASTPANSYYIAHFNSPGGSWTETWIVPSSSTPIRLSAVQALLPPSPSYIFPFVQISPPANCAALGGIPSYSVIGGWTCVSALVNPATTEGDLLVEHAGALVRLPTANPTYVLTSNGLGAIPSWQPGGGASTIYPAAGVANSTGSAWGTSYQVGTAANDLVQLTGADKLPAVDGSLVTDVAAITAAALATTPVQCPSTQIVTGVQANGDANCQDPLVSGPTAIGAAPGVNNPVFMAGWDGTDIRALLTDTSGHAIVNINGTVPVSGTFWQATQPVSIASLPSLPAGAATIGAVNQAGTWDVGITGALPTGGNTIGGVNIENVPGVNVAQLNGVALTSPSAYGTAPSGNVQGVNADVTNTVTVAQGTGSSLHADVDNFPSTQAVSGTVTANQGGAPWTATVQPSSASTAALSNFTPGYITSATTLDASPGNLFTFQIHDSGTAACYLEFFNAASGSVTLGTTAPIWVVGLFPTATNQFEVNSPSGLALNFSTALSVAAVTVPGGSTTCPASTAFLNAGYK